jgi:uncharacterized protein
MPHQCVHCSKIYPDASKELLEGCSCGSKFFFYIRKEHLEKIQNKEIEIVLSDEEKIKIEKDVREIMGIEEEFLPVILDLESVRVIKPGKFEIDVVNLFNNKKPIVYRLEEGKYFIDLASSLKRVKE